ncbi:hypothetical protein CEE69_04610 [Rhodopirellula bahusiensis]|uniref:Uncharacterized protein n=1 Tax=Rhodopirellula bahusiensis TaxID=2014065 RepID=A0A2G1WC85_9BACT|nr:hypothetical protein CEE69_04610 [Rhodopirellula bahusiensis]
MSRTALAAVDQTPTGANAHRLIFLFGIRLNQQSAKQMNRNGWECSCKPFEC